MSTARRIATLTVASAVTATLAYLQSRLLVQAFGAGGTLDAYYLATAVPMAAMMMLAAGGNSLLVPLFASKGRDDPGARGSLSLQLLIVFAAIGTLVCAAVASSLLGFWPSMGLGVSDGWLWLIVLGSGAYGLSLYPQVVLTAEHHPSWFAWAQSFSFVVFIALLRWLEPAPTRYAVAGLYLAGGWPSWLSRGQRLPSSETISLGVCIHARSFGVGGGTLFSVLLVVAAMQSVGVVDRWFAGRYEAGFVTSFALADKIVQTLVLSLAVTVATVVFPRLVDMGEEGSVRTGKSFVAVMLLLVPMSAVLVAFPLPLIELAYGGGRFRGDWF